VANVHRGGLLENYVELLAESSWLVGSACLVLPLVWGGERASGGLGGVVWGRHLLGPETTHTCVCCFWVVPGSPGVRRPCVRCGHAVVRMFRIGV
jgi:hypothetical protein